MSVYGASGENVSQYTRKGSRVGIDGRLAWREWETAEQERRQAVSIVAERVQFLDSPGERASAGEDGGEDDRELAGIGVGGEGDLTF